MTINITERELIEQLCRDLNEAHTELMVAQGADREGAVRLDWPRWTPQANSLRLAEEMLGRPLSKTSLGRIRPACHHGSAEYCPDCEGRP